MIFVSCRPQGGIISRIDCSAAHSARHRLWRLGRRKGDYGGISVSLGRESLGKGVALIQDYVFCAER